MRHDRAILPAILAGDGQSSVRIFALAFGVFAVNRLTLALLENAHEARTLVHLSRSVAFALIAYAIRDKSRSPPECRVRGGGRSVVRVSGAVPSRGPRSRRAAEYVV
ncbi:MAG: DUF5985 family protein [Chloroflexota bacterium]|nr:DUF5985 family protein [Chloroflexota bacterium]